MTKLPHPAQAGRLAGARLPGTLLAGALLAGALLVAWLVIRPVSREGGDSPGGRIDVSAASSLRDVLTDMASRYEESHPDTRVRLNFGASNVLARQIVEGAPADVFFTADGRAMDLVERAERLVPGSRIDLLSNVLVVMVSQDAPLAIHVPDDLVSSRVRRIALCDDAVPLGRYARAWLAWKGVLERLGERIVRPDDARAALAMVESGSVDAGFVYRTDARHAKRARIALEIPAAETGIVYPAALVRDGHDPAGGRDFLTFATSPPASWLFTGAGFIFLPKR